ncbi:MAG: glycosyltransferase family 2 protein [Spirochaetae bacterium HGW-Spirochaetae-2]|nr:MAG: glycosyltransferase family 2 protein [Spirochaetae bacterium HGW-Spirochaetae-2]
MLIIDQSVVSNNQLERKIAAGIVLYNPDISRLQQNVETIVPQVEKLYIIDNNSKNIEQVEHTLKDYKKIIFLRNFENLGIAQALNQISLKAYQAGFEWLLTLDQDTVCPHDLVASYIPYIDDDFVGIICPQFKIVGQKTKLVDKETIPLETVELCITSASLTRLLVWDFIEGYNNWLFIDGVDYDYCIRVRRAGYKILRVNHAVIDHQVGDPELIKLPFGLSIKIYNHSDFRNYYIVRNNIYLLKTYWKELHGFGWVFRLIYFEILKILFEKNKIKTIKSILKGLRDGFFNLC